MHRAQWAASRLLFPRPCSRKLSRLFIWLAQMGWDGLSRSVKKICSPAFFFFFFFMSLKSRGSLTLFPIYLSLYSPQHSLSRTLWSDDGCGYTGGGSSSRKWGRRKKKRDVFVSVLQFADCSPKGSWFKCSLCTIRMSWRDSPFPGTKRWSCPFSHLVSNSSVSMFCCKNSR